MIRVIACILVEVLVMISLGTDMDIQKGKKLIRKHIKQYKMDCYGQHVIISKKELDRMLLNVYQEGHGVGCYDEGLARTLDSILERLEAECAN